jgi:enamine deaminase RidA (YjgF/YER057c/UK114 family)
MPIIEHNPSGVFPPYQAELVWKHLTTILASAGMTVSNLVSLRPYLADPRYDAPQCHWAMRTRGRFSCARKPARFPSAGFGVFVAH